METRLVGSMAEMMVVAMAAMRVAVKAGVLGASREYGWVEKMVAL